MYAVRIFMSNSSRTIIGTSFLESTASSKTAPIKRTRFGCWIWAMILTSLFIISVVPWISSSAIWAYLIATASPRKWPESTLPQAPIAISFCGSFWIVERSIFQGIGCFDTSNQAESWSFSYSLSFAVRSSISSFLSWIVAFFTETISERTMY